MLPIITISIDGTQKLPTQLRLQFEVTYEQLQILKKQGRVDFYATREQLQELLDHASQNA